MQPLAEPVSRLIDAFAQLPGIGPKTASRLAYFLLRSDESIALNLAKALEELKANTLFCSICFNIADRDPCPVCDDAQRNHALICVVEEPLDVRAIERTGEYAGVYHVLHGAISPVEGSGPTSSRLRSCSSASRPGAALRRRTSTPPMPRIGRYSIRLSRKSYWRLTPTWRERPRPCTSPAWSSRSASA